MHLRRPNVPHRSDQSGTTLLCLSVSLPVSLFVIIIRFCLSVCLSTQVSERVQTLSKDTEERRELLETRLKSWEVFPVEKAREVKSFVETMERSMNLELDENCSTEELMEQLRHLEVGGVHVHVGSMSMISLFLF